MYGVVSLLLSFFFFNDTATTEIYTLSLHDALPIYDRHFRFLCMVPAYCKKSPSPDRKSTRLNSSHANISYAVFCLKKKTNIRQASLLVCHAGRHRSERAPRRAT